MRVTILFVKNLRFITKNKQNRVGVDAYSVQGSTNEQYLVDHNLNVSHRTSVEDIENIQIQGYVHFNFKFNK